MVYWRHLLKNKSYFIINLLGLTLGLSSSIFILFYVQDELNYDQYLPGNEKVIRIQPMVLNADGEQPWATSEGFLAPSISSMYPDIDVYTRVLRNDSEIIFKIDSTQFSEDGIIAVDSTFFKVFPFEFVHGDQNTALDKPDGIVITQKVSKRFFGDSNPVGRSLSTDFATYTVTGVIVDVPRNSHFHFNVLFPLAGWWPDADQSRNMYAFYSYLRFKSPDQVEVFNQKVLKTWYGLYGNANETEPSAAQTDARVTLRGIRLPDIHLRSRAEKEFEANGQLQVVYIFIAVGFLIMVVASINYINLSNALAIKRTKEVAIRKTIGASRRKLFHSFMMESYVFSLLVFVISLLVVALLIPQFNMVTGKDIDIRVLTDIRFIVTILVAWIILGFLSGFYPAMILSSFNPVQALKSDANSGKTSNVSLYLRRGLIVTQFTISALMIVSAITVQQQLDFIESRNIGFNKHNVVIVPLVGEAREKAETLKNEINKLEVIESCAAASVVPGKRIFILNVRVPDLAGSNITTQGTDDGTREMRVMGVDHDFVKTLGLRIIDGRDFSHENAADAQGAFLLNEAAVKELNLKDPVGRPFEYVFREIKRGKVIGVLEDFNFASAHTRVEPVMLHIYPPFYSTLCIRLKTQHLQAGIEEIEAAYKTITSAPFSYQFLDTTYDALYKTDRTTGKVIVYFTVLSIVIAGFGLFGIVSFFAAQRTKEVGIRKIFGASHTALIKILSNEYVIMVIVGNVIAIYPGWFLVNQWLHQFAYHIDLSASIFFIAFLVSVISAFCSIIYMLFRIASTNPITILRNE